MDLKITRKDFIDYTLFPQLRPRIMQLFASGFEFIPYFIALVYQSVRLLPANHPYSDASNIGRFGIRHVIAEAANNLKVEMRNIDQLLMFGLILVGMVLILMQFGLLGMALFVRGAEATGFGSYFVAPNGEQDLAHIMMDLVFGVPGLFNSCVAQGTACLDLNGNPFYLPGSAIPADMPVPNNIKWPFPIHDGLHNLFAIYSQGLLVIAAFMTIYFVTTILAETAQTGTPFGKRYSHVWAPIRLVVAFGLLVPLGSGLNGAQYSVLYAAKYGSAFASNGWVLFINELNANHKVATETVLHTTDEQGNLVAIPNVPEIGTFLQYMFVAKTCEFSMEAAYKQKGEDIDIKPYLVRGGMVGNAEELARPGSAAGSGPGSFDPENYDQIDNATPYDSLIEFANGSSRVLLRFGVRDEEEYARYRGNVKPICGEITLRLEDPRKSRFAGGSDGLTADGASASHFAEPGAEILQRYYWYVTKELWWTDAVFTRYTDTAGDDLDRKHYPQAFVKKYVENYVEPDPNNPNYVLPENDTSYATSFSSFLQNFYSQELGDILTSWTFPSIDGASAEYTQGAVKGQELSGRWELDTTMRDKGWPIFAAFYNKLSEMGGLVSAATLNVPLPTRYPAIMETIREVKKRTDQNPNMEDPYAPELGDGRSALPYLDATEQQAYDGMYQAFLYWKTNKGTSTHTQPTGNAFLDTINAIFGTQGLFDMRKNADVHPLAQLVGLGRTLVDSSINNLGYAAMGGVAGFLANALNMPSVAGAADTLSGFLVTVGMLGLVVGFILFYIMPFLPFIYFFFAFGGWVKGIFEAMVGAPLWALAHIRIDGNGLPGQAAVNGYYLIFEIFLRPILIVFGFLASLMIFSATVAALNDMFTLVTANLGGGDPTTITSASGDASVSMEYFRGPVDEFFFTIIYALIVYMMGMASFKLIDLIPNYIMRWMGQNVTAFNDQREDPAGKLVQTAQLGGQQLSNSLGQGYKGVLQGLSKAGQSS